MVMKVEPFHEALVALKLRTKKGAKTAAGKKVRVILTSAKGKMFTQKDAIRLSKINRLVFLCGRYEGGTSAWRRNWQTRNYRSVLTF